MDSRTELVNAVTKFRFIKCWEFFTSWGTVSCTGRTIFHGVGVIPPTLQTPIRLSTIVANLNCSKGSLKNPKNWQPVFLKSQLNVDSYSKTDCVHYSWQLNSTNVYMDLILYRRKEAGLNTKASCLCPHNGFTCFVSFTTNDRPL